MAQVHRLFDASPEAHCRIGRVIEKRCENVVIADIVTSHDLPPMRVLAAAAERGLVSVIVVGYDKDGDEYFASSLSDGGDALWLLSRAQTKLLDTVK